ncbi:hypothetical protein BDB01DRAFT_839561 [Pilobolus umbonatus]|nr:hypothetical protein BDB01DRAFT_839561 [Pilobolus umbonatus]
MPYSSYSDPLLHVTWYKFDHVSHLYESMKQIDLTSTQSRNTGLDAIHLIQPECPFAYHTRFPENEWFICVPDEDWNMILPMIEHVLIQGEKVEFDGMIEQLSTLFFTEDRVYNRSRFEELCEWTEYVER